MVALIELYLSLLIPLAFPFAFGRMARRAGHLHQTRVILSVMVVLLALITVGAMVAESRGNDALPAGIDQESSSTQPGGNLEGKELRLGEAGSALTTVGTMGTTTGLTTMAVSPRRPRAVACHWLPWRSVR